MEATYYFELHLQLKFKTEVMCTSSKDKYIQETTVLGSLETSLRIQGKPQKNRGGELGVRLALGLVHRPKVKSTSRKGQVGINTKQEFQK